MEFQQTKKMLGLEQAKINEKAVNPFAFHIFLDFSAWNDEAFRTVGSEGDDYALFNCA